LCVFRAAAQIVVAGGGPTMLKFRECLLRCVKKYSSKRISGIKYHRKQYYLVDGANAVLSTMSKASQEDTLEALTKLGVVEIHDRCRLYGMTLCILVMEKQFKLKI
jgi:NADH dehydrogenase